MPTAAEIKGLFDDQQTAWAAMKKEIQKEIVEIKELGHAFPETIEKLNKLNGRIDEIETKLNRTVDPPAVDPNERSVGMRAFEKFMRYDRETAYERMDEAERNAYKGAKSLAVQDDNTVGTIVPEDFRAEVIKRLPNLANVQSLVRHETTSRDVIRYPRLTHTTSDAAGTILGTTDIATNATNVVWEDELAEITETDFSLGQITINLFKMRGAVRVGRELLEDAAIDVTGLIAGFAAERIAIEIDRVVTKGTGGKQPEGFLTNSLIPTVTVANGNQPSYAGLVDTWSALPEQYAKNASWMMKRATIGALRKIVDSVGQPIWQPGLQAGMPSTLLGHSIQTNEHMPAVGFASANAIAFADWMTLYLFVMKTGMTIQRLDEKYASTDEVGFYIRQRVGGKVIGEWAARYNQMS